MDPAILTTFGPAGLIAAMWLLERRQSVARDRAIAEAHEMLRVERREARELIRLVRDTTRALTAVERTQRAVVAALAVLAGGGGRGEAERKSDGAGKPLPLG